MNQINPKKLNNSKWTKINPSGSEKHFIINKVIFDEYENVKLCVLQAVINNKEYDIDWRTLKNDDEWIHGWI